MRLDRRSLIAMSHLSSGLKFNPRTIDQISNFIMTSSVDISDNYICSAPVDALVITVTLASDLIWVKINSLYSLMPDSVACRT